MLAEAVYWSKRQSCFLDPRRREENEGDDPGRPFWILCKRTFEAGGYYIRHMKSVHNESLPLSTKRCRARLSYAQKFFIVQEWHRLKSWSSQTMFARSQNITSRMLRYYLTDERLQSDEGHKRPDVWYLYLSCFADN